MKTRTNTIGIAVLSNVIATILIAAFLFVSQGFAAEANDAGKGDITTATTVSAVSSKVPMSSCQVSLSASLPYTAKLQCPEPVVKYGGRQLVKGQDYEVSYKDNKGIGNAAAVITGKGGFEGTVAKTFRIEYSNIAIAVAACRLSYSKSRIHGSYVNDNNGYKGTVMYQKYNTRKWSYNCARVVWLAIDRYLKLDRKYPSLTAQSFRYLKRSKNWKKVCTYRMGMENKKNTPLRPGDVYNTGAHTCLYVGREVPQIVYSEFLKTDPITKKKLKKKNPDLGRPSKKAVWVSSHALFMNGSPAHICGRGDALVQTGGYIFRYVGKPNKVNAAATK